MTEQDFRAAGGRRPETSGGIKLSKAGFRIIRCSISRAFAVRGRIQLTNGDRL
jgi:hypothetical protein